MDKEDEWVSAIRARLDDAEAWLREEFAPSETELSAFAALRAVLDLCDDGPGTAQLREQIADVLLRRGGLGSWMPGQIEVVRDDLVGFVLAQVKAAKATARREALEQAADYFERVAGTDSSPYLAGVRHTVQGLRARASTQADDQRDPGQPRVTP